MKPIVVQRIAACFAACLAACALAGAASPALAAEVRVLSAGAVEPGLKAVVERYERDSGDTVRISFAAAPALRERTATREAAAAAGYDLLIAPLAVLDAALAAGAARGERAVLGSVGIGVVVRTGAPLPDVATPESLKAALQAADAVVYNRASTGVLVERIVRDLGLADALAPKTTRVADGAAVMQQLLQGRGRDIGFGAITEIVLHKDQGLTLAGPLPPALQTRTTYAAALAAQPRDDAAALRLWRRLGSADALARFRDAGID